MNKSQRYRARMKKEGRCPHCGKPCAPFFECEERRAYKNAQRRARLKGLGPILFKEGQWVAASSNEAITPYTSSARDARRLPRRDRPRHKPTSLLSWDQMSEEQLRVEVMGLLSYTPLEETQIEQILQVKQLLHISRQIAADPTSSAEERLFARHLVREHLPDCIAMLHRCGLNVSQIVAMLRACHASVRYHWLKCEHNIQTRPLARWIWSVAEDGKPRRLRRLSPGTEPGTSGADP
jgi:hypothetical protein